MTDRVPPHDLAAEQAVLGAMMLSREAVAVAVERLRPEDFYRAAHSTIYEAVTRAWADQEPTDVVSVMARLAASGDLGRIGGAPALHDLVEMVPVAASVGYHAKIVAERANVRRIIEAAQRIAQMGYETRGELGDLPAQASKLMADAIDDRQSAGLTPIASLVNPSLDALEDMVKNGRSPGIMTGIAALDDATGGLRPGQLVIVAGRPGAGKSVMGVEVAREVAVNQRRQVALFTLEMTKDEVLYRMYAAAGTVVLPHILTGAMTQTEWDKVAKVAGELAEAPLSIDDSAPLTLPILISRARRAHARSPLALVVIDYLQLITLGRRTESRQQEVSEISKALKLLGKELGCPVLVAAQLNRESEKRADKRPQLSDLRESGSIEADADIVILVHRDNYYDPNTPRGNEADLILAKNRHGQTGSVVAAAQFEYARFINLPQL